VTREIAIERPACDFAKSRGWFEAKIASSNRNGMPDRIFHRRGYTMYVEFKAPGEGPTVQQEKRHREIRSYGIPVHVCDDLEEAYELFR
jgi:hypothetical protein